MTSLKRWIGRITFKTFGPKWVPVRIKDPNKKRRVYRLLDTRSRRLLAIADAHKLHHGK